MKLCSPNMYQYWLQVSVHLIIKSKVRMYSEYWYQKCNIVCSLHPGKSSGYNICILLAELIFT